MRKLLFVKNRLRYPHAVVYTQKDKDYLLKNGLAGRRTQIHPIMPAIKGIEPDFATENKTKIAYVGRLANKQKNVAFLNEITECAAKSGDPIEINVYGSGPDEKLLSNNPHIVLHGYVGPESLAKVFGQTKVLLLPSKYEGIGLVLLEAMAAGTPCVVANTYLNASCVANASRGALIEGFDAARWAEEIKRIVSLPDGEYRELARNCAVFAQSECGYDRFAKRWLDLIDRA